MITEPTIQGGQKRFGVMRKWLTSDGMDRFSRYFFPGVFILFNLMYWIGYNQKKVFVNLDY